MEKSNNNEIDILENKYSDAKYIRKELQINNEELYYIYTYINLYDKSKEELEKNISKIESILLADGLRCVKSVFREEEIFFATMPLMKNPYIIKKAAKRNILTSSGGATYPFISNELRDKNGILIGVDKDNLLSIFINKFDRNKYRNGNTCIFGMSGSGKSFLVKLLIIRYRIFGKKQYIIDTEGEYKNICNKLDGEYIKIGFNSKTYINIFDIGEEEKNNKKILLLKINRLMIFFELIFEKISTEEKVILEEKLILLYKQKKNPKMEDFYNILKKDSRTGEFAEKIIPFVSGSMSFFNNNTNINIENKLIVADISEMEEENIKYAMFIFIDLFWEHIKKNNKEEKIIYLEELWRLIGVTSNKFVASFIYKMFKTIRKFNGCAVSITQDISDMFSLEDGKYGNSIINNSCIKVIFYLEEQGLEELDKSIKIQENSREKIKSLKKGEGILIIEKNELQVKFIASKEEKEIIENEK